MYRHLLIAMTALFCCLSDVVAGEEKLEVFSGLYTTQLYNIDFQQQQFDIQFWLWFVHEQQDYQPWQSIEVSNAKTHRVVTHRRTQIDDKYFDLVKIQAVIRGEWSLSFYPFDQQTLVVELKDKHATSDKLQFVVDRLHSGLDTSMLPHGWDKTSLRIKSHNNQSPTTFGDPRLSIMRLPLYSQISMSYDLKRQGTRLFIHLFLGFFFAIILSALVIVIHCSKSLYGVIAMSDLITISMGALLTTAVSIYTLSNTLPYTTELVLADHIQIFTLLNILLSIVMTICTRLGFAGQSMTLIDTTTISAKRYRINRTIAWLWLITIVIYFAIFFLG